MKNLENRTGSFLSLPQIDILRPSVHFKNAKGNSCVYLNFVSALFCCSQSPRPPHNRRLRPHNLRHNPQPSRSSR